ncbi:protein NETWORKED 1D-like isoform X3 [Mizuhopecten yessoensis]|uniref:protein NETWORKED 1D-like isoform X3 n=1 Tax=Mizuhopecten yessoensis TaxID=6573 RepID=UPI000B458388|nr:protein NETWORKED 1D-like isoform X3 [Mizuhopecten yessoensis]
MASKCQKFQPNIFNKLKCQSCFGAKDIHSAEALENNKDMDDTDESVNVSPVGWVDQFCNLMLDTFISKTEPVATRKISKCGYLFVSPDFDFSNPLDRTKRWQRRFFRLFDDGELNFSVDEDPDTVPQGAVDMNKCTEVGDAEKKTSHTNSLFIIVPNKTYYIKGGSKEEIMWWQEVLAVFPRSLPKPKNRRFTMPIFSNKDKENVQPLTTDSHRKLPSVSSLTDGDIPAVNNRFEAEKVKVKEQAFSTYRGVRNMKHRTDKHYQEGLRKSSSLHDLSSEDAKDVGMGLASSKFLSRSGDRLNYVSVASHPGMENAARVLADSNYNNPYCTVPRRTWQTLAANTTSPPSSNANIPSSASANSPSSSPSSHPTVVVNPSHIPIIRRKSNADTQSSAASTSTKPKSASERARLHRERSTSMKDFPTQFSLPKPDGSRMSMSSLDRLSASSGHVDGQSSARPSGRRDIYEVPTNNLNQTDELKMAKSTEFQAASRSRSQPSISGSSPQSQGSPSNKYEDLMYMKKGWLIKQGTSEKDWKKHWFVLTGNSLRYYRDAQAEESNTLDGRIDLSTCFDISEVDIGRNFGFRIKSRNGEYVLAAMTSGIRNNWLKAIRLVMDLQTGSKQSTSSLLSNSADSSPRTVDDLDLSASADSSRLSGSMDSRSSSESPKDIHKRATTKNMRRHYSDVSPGNVKFSVKDLSPALTRISQPPTIVGVVSGATSPPEPEKKSGLDDQVDSANKKSVSSAKFSPEPSASEPLGRYVEGSDSASLTSTLPPPAPEAGEDLASRRAVSSESRKEEDEKSRRAKSPSARVKEKSRSKGGKIPTPPQQMSDDEYYGMSASAEEETVSSIQVIDLQQHLGGDGYQDSNFTTSEDTQASTGDSSAGGDGILVELLETEVTTMRRQVKEARDTIQKNKVEIESLRSKLDMSTSKLTGTERALSEALKELKNEKDKLMKMSNDWNKKIRNLEGQLKDTTHKMERQRDSLNVKETECKRLESDVKANSQKMREHEREILKLKAVEQDNRQMKEKTEDIERKMAALKLEVKEKDMHCKKVESEYEHHIVALEQEFAQERDDMDQHLEDMKKKFMEAQEHSNASNTIPNNMAAILQEKDMIIAQLEDKMIENDKKFIDMADELQSELDESVVLQNNLESVQKDQSKLEKKLRDQEKLYSKVVSEKQKGEEENKSLTRTMEEYKKESRELGSLLDSEKNAAVKWQKEKKELLSKIHTLEDNRDTLQQKLDNKGSKMSHDSTNSEEDRSKISDILGNFVVVEAEMSEVTKTMIILQKNYTDILSKQSEKSQSQLVGMGPVMADIVHRCAHLQDLLREGSSDLSTPRTTDQGQQSEEFSQMKVKYDNLVIESNKLRKQLEDMSGRSKDTQNSKELELKLAKQESVYKQKIQEMATRVDDLTGMVKHAGPSKASSPQKPKKQEEASAVLSAEIEAELGLLEDRIAYIDQVLRTPDISMSGEDEEEEDDEDEESDSFISSDDEMSEEDEEEEDTNELSGGYESKRLIGKLRAMRNQLQVTNCKIQDLTEEMTEKTFLKNNSSGEGDEGLRQTLDKCSDAVDSLTSRLIDKVKAAKLGGASLESSSAENMVAFQNCVKQMRDKLVEVNCMVAEHEALDAKSLKIVHEKLMNLLEYLSHLQRFKHQDFDMLGRITHQDLQAKAVITRRESGIRRSRLHFEEKVHLYADRLSVEAIILGQMAYLVQRYQMGDVYRDLLLKEIQDVNMVILDLERKIDDATKTNSSSETGVDIVSSYAAILAEKIVLEGQLASCAMAADNQTTDDTAVLSALHITENPSILAMEVFLRSQVDSSVHQKLHQATEHMDSVTGHIITRSLVQGEITHALARMKSRFSLKDGVRDVTDLLRQERKFSHEQLLCKCETMCNSVDVYQALVVSSLRYHACLAQSPKIGENLCTKMSQSFHKRIEEFQEKQSTSEGREQNRCQHIIGALEVELESSVRNFKELEQPDLLDTEDAMSDVTVGSVESTVLQLADILMHRAIIKGTVEYITDMVSSGSFPELPNTAVFSSEHVLGADQNETMQVLARSLSNEATNKQSLAAELKKFNPENAASSEECSRIVDILGIVPDSELCNINVGTYGENLLREALHQAQLTYMSYKMKLHHERSMREMKMKIEAGQKVDLPSDSSREAEGDIHASLSVFEEILETKFEDECEVLSILDKEIKQLNSVSTDSKEKGYSQQLNNLISTFENELAVSQERHDIHVDVLRQEVSNIVMRLEKMTDDYEKEREVVVSEYEGKVSSLQEELETIQVDHEEELEQVRQDIMTAVSAIRANEEEVDGQLSDQVKGLNRQIISQKGTFSVLLTELQEKLAESNLSPTLSTQVQKLVDQLQEALNSGTEFEDPLSPLPVSSPPPLPVAPRKSESLSDVPAMETLNLTDDSFHTLDRSQHDYELELLKREKEEALAEEVKTTKAALDAMRKAYEDDLEEEKERYRIALKTMYNDDYIQEIRRQQDEELVRVKEELKTTTMHYDSKCEDYKIMEEKLNNVKTEYESHIQHLVKSNQHLNELVNEEIGKLKDFMENRSMGRIPGNATLEEELYDAQIMVRMKDAELQKLRSQVKNLENNLERVTEEQRNSMTQYLQMYKKVQELEAKQKSKKQEEQDHDSRPTNRSLRRTPSFHHRARSPSPQTSGKKDEHHSRDSHRRRHLDARDLKRSKSSPTIPFVFGGRLPSSSSLGKSSSFKSAKAMKASK